MPGNFANTYFANQLDIQQKIITALDEIDTGRILTAVSGQNIIYSIDDDPTPDNFELYIPLPGSLVATQGLTNGTTSITIKNPNSPTQTIDIRTADWFGGSPTAIISTNSYPVFGGKNSVITTTDAQITFYLYQNPSNPSEKAWFYL